MRRWIFTCACWRRQRRTLRRSCGSAWASLILIHTQSWPQVDEEAAADEEITLVVQVNGKVRDRITLPVGISDEKAKEIALASEVVQKHLAGAVPRKVIVVPGKLVNIVL